MCANFLQNNFEESMEFYDYYAYLEKFEQYYGETTFEYFERFKCMLEDYPNHGLMEHELIIIFLDGMLPTERRILDDISPEGSILECYPMEIWNLIEERAENTRPYMEDNSEQPLEEMVYQLALTIQQNAEKNEKRIAEIAEKVLLLNKELLELKKVRSISPEPTHFYDDECEVMEESDQKDEDVMDESLQIVPTTCNKDVYTESEDFTSSHCLERIATQVIKDHKFEEAPLKDQVWHSLYEKDLKILMANCCDFRKIPKELNTNWKRRKKDKHMVLDEEVFPFFLPMQKRHYTFGWKPGWDSCGMTFEKMEKKLRRPWKKFDGVHPWAPNI